MQMALPGQELHAAFNFVVQLDGIQNAVFSECTLPTLEVDFHEQKEGGYNTGVHVLPGPVKAGRLTLKRGLVKSNELLKWYCDVASGTAKRARSHVSVIMYDGRQVEIMRFKTADSAVAIETLELAFTDIQVDYKG
jgi:phage tail-like protein